MPETQARERKRSWRDEHLKWFCGLANARGGVLEIGTDEGGEIVDVENPLRLLEEIPNRALAGVVVDVGLRSQEGGEYLEVAVDPYANPINCKGRYQYRTGSTKQVLRGAALNRFLRRKHGRNWNDAPEPVIGLKDLHRRALDGFRRRSVANDRVSLWNPGELPIEWTEAELPESKPGAKPRPESQPESSGPQYRLTNDRRSALDATTTGRTEP